MYHSYILHISIVSCQPRQKTCLGNIIMSHREKKGSMVHRQFIGNKVIGLTF